MEKPNASQSKEHALFRGDRVVNFRPMLLFAAAFALGIFCACRFGTAALYFALAGVPVLLAAAALWIFKKKAVFGVVLYSALFCALFLVGALSFSLRVGAFESLPVLDGEYTVTGTVENVGASESGTILTVGDLSVFADAEEGIVSPGGKLSVYVFGGSGFAEGDRLVFDAALTTNDIWTYGRVNASAILEKTRYRASVQAEDLFLVDSRFDLFGSVRAAFRDRVFSSMDPSTASIAYALLTGDSGFMEDEVLQNFRYGGIAHVFAVSGLHVGVVYGLANFLLRRLRAHRFVRLPAIAALLVFYAGVCNFTPSAVRALVMCCVLMLFDAFGWAYDRLTSVSIAFFVVLVLNPVNLYSVGFQLSVAAAAGIIVLGGHLTRLLGRIPRLPRKLASALGVSFSAQAATFPILLDAFGYVSGLSLLLNLVFVPLIGAVYSVLFVAALLACLLPFAANVLLFVPQLLLRVAVAPVLAAEFGVLLICGFSFGGAAVALWYGGVFFLSDKVNLKMLPKAVGCCLLCLVFTAAMLLRNVPAGRAVMTVHGYYGSNAVLMHGDGQTSLVLTGVPDGEYLERLFLQEGIEELEALVVLADHSQINAAVPVVLRAADVQKLYVRGGGGFVNSFRTIEVCEERGAFAFGGADALFIGDTALYLNCLGSDVLLCGSLPAEPLPHCDLLVAAAYEEALSAACMPVQEIYFEKTEGKICVYHSGDLQIVWKDDIITVSEIR